VWCRLVLRHHHGARWHIPYGSKHERHRRVSGRKRERAA
jgi:hypothetical protein